MKSLAAIRPAGSQILTLPRPSYVVRNCTSGDDSSEDEEIFEKRPTRKRQRLDHLSPEEKLQRRKLKNRVAAQTARDRKKARMDDLEASVANLEKEVEKLKTENDLLWKLNSNLRTENETLKAALEKKNAKEAACSELTAEVKSEMPVDPAAIINAPLQREQGFRSQLPVANLPQRSTKAFLPLLILAMLSNSTNLVPMSTTVRTANKAGIKSLPNLRPFSPMKSEASRRERLARAILKVLAKRKPPPPLRWRKL